MERWRLRLKTHAHYSVSVLIIFYPILSCQHLWYPPFCRPGEKKKILFIKSNTSVGYVFQGFGVTFLYLCVSVSQHKAHRHQCYRPREISTHGRFHHISLALFWLYFKIISVYYTLRKSSTLWLHMKLHC